MQDVYRDRTHRDAINLWEEYLMKLPSIFPEEYLRKYIENDQKAIALNQSVNASEMGMISKAGWKYCGACRWGETIGLRLLKK